MRWFLAAGVLLALPSPALAEAFLLCSAQGKSDLVLEIDAVAFNEDVVLSCVSGDFIADLTPCAPDGGFGLSAPTGSSALVGVVYRWQDYADHTGGVVFYQSSPSEYVFSGGFAFFGEYREEWTVSVSRLTGSALVSLSRGSSANGQVDVSREEFDCQAAMRKF
jgi:hypothetical protein